MFKDDIAEELYAQAIGREILQYIKDYRPQLLAQQADSDAIALVKEIKAILDDDTLDDPNCFQRVDALVEAFHSRGISTRRHWELE